ncbi:transcriptional regulator [Desulfocucumis palustris]|uniref:Transcriptional regulator n=1 Tax=Desulfocucumis palustris TaxID=1898651 RepID=A0A2L2X9L5_9FIRM|nr:MerR family transcriptional regulator [Desulfocucumis palustris]GBF32732.1 transcriptional regulator [Desulfocucumis palustris]
MENRLKISDFAKLTGTTLKTILYYHKIGLLQEPERSPGGYRLYGPVELSRMRLIKRLKSLGMDLTRIKEMLGDTQNKRTLREALQSLQVELLNQIKSLEERVARIEALLDKDLAHLDEDVCGSPSFQMLTEILGPDQIEKYARTCPELFDQQQKLRSIMDDFRWGDYQDTYQTLAEYFKAHPEHYQTSLNFGARLARLAHLDEDDPEIETLARESAEFIKSIPQLEEMLCNKPRPKHDGLLNGMVSRVLSPAQMKHKQLLEKYLNSKP